MEFAAIPGEVYMMLRVVFKDPLLELLKEEQRISIIGKFLKAFDLRLNDLKFNIETPSNNHIHFIKFYGFTSIEVSFGYEEVTANLRNPQDEKQLADIYNKLFQIIGQYPISTQRIVINSHFSTKNDTSAFLESLNPSHAID